MLVISPERKEMLYWNAWRITLVILEYISMPLQRDFVDVGIPTDISTCCTLSTVVNLTACFVTPFSAAHLSKSSNICAHGPSVTLFGCLRFRGCASAAVLILFDSFDADCPIFESVVRVSQWEGWSLLISDTFASAALAHSWNCLWYTKMHDNTPLSETAAYFGGKEQFT